MELNQIQSSALNWGEAASSLNQNFSKIGSDMEKMKYATTRNKGYFSSGDALKSTVENAVLGDIAYVKSEVYTPYELWEWTSSGWVATGKSGGNESVNLGEYYTKEDTDKKLSELESEVFNLDREDWSLEKTYVVKAGDGHIILPYLGKTACTFYISGTSPQKFRIQAKNKDTGNSLNIVDATSTAKELPFEIANPRTDLELVDVDIFFPSTATNGDTITIKIVKGNPLEKAIEKNAEQDKTLANHASILESQDEQLTNIFNLDKEDWSLEKTYVVKPGTEHIILPYLGKTPCTFYISGTSPQRFRIQATNKETSNAINIIDASSTATSLPLEIANPRTDLELINVTLRFSSLATEGDITIKIVKSNPLEKVITKNAEQDKELASHKAVLESHDEQLTNIFNLDREDWSLEKTYVVKPGTEHIILPYLGKTPCTFYISGTSPQRFRIQAKNKATSNAINIIDASSTTTSLPLEIANSRTDLELVDVNIFFPSTANSGDTITIKIVKSNPLEKAIKQTDDNDAELSALQLKLFNLDRDNWEYEKTFAAKPSAYHLILPYLGKTPCTFYISGTSPQRFRIQAKNKATSNAINIIDAISTARELPIEIVNPRTDLDLVDVALEFSSLATEGDITIKIVKNNPLEKVVYNLNWDAKNRGCYTFGNGIDYNPPMVEVPAIMSNFTQLQPWYDLYDALVSQYPNYVSKENCDSVFLSANPSVEKPSALADLPIYMYKFIPAYPKRDSTGRPTNKSKLKVLITTGTHPEYIAMWSCYQTMKRICESWSTDANLKALRWDVEFYIIPCSGPWGITHATRTNANGVDLNRNMPNRDWVLSGQVGDNTYSGPSAGSEYENKLLAYYIDTINPVIYIDYHNFGINKGGGLMYGTSSDKLAVDITINAFQEICSELSIHYSDLPNADSANFELCLSYFGQSEGKGVRHDYASEKNNMIGLVYENSYSIYWENGVLNTSGEGHIRDELVCSIAANSWVRFLCYIIKGVADNWIPL